MFPAIVFCSTIFRFFSSLVWSDLIWSGPGCVPPLQEVTLRHSPPTLSVLCGSCPYHSLLFISKNLSKDVLVFPLILHPQSAILCLETSVYCRNVSSPIPFRYLIRVLLCLSLCFFVTRRRTRLTPTRTSLTTKLYGCKQELEKTTSFISRTALIVWNANAKKKRRRHPRVGKCAAPPESV